MPASWRLSAPGIFLLVTMLAPLPVRSDDPSPDWPAIEKAVSEFLKAKPRAEKSLRSKVLRLVDKDLSTLAKALREQPPMTQHAAGNAGHGSFRVGSEEVKFWARVPAGYDGMKRFPVCMQPGAARNVSEVHDALRDWIIFDLKIERSNPQIMAAALRHLRLHFRVDPERILLFGSAIHGVKALEYAAIFPDDFSAVIADTPFVNRFPRFEVDILANLESHRVRIFQHKEDSHGFDYATDVISRLKAKGADAELIEYGWDDFPTRGGKLSGTPPGFMLDRLSTWLSQQRRALPTGEFQRAIRYPSQAFFGAFQLRKAYQPPKKKKRKGPPPPAHVVELSNEGGSLRANMPAVSYLVPLEDLETPFRVGKKKAKVEPDPALMLTVFKILGDPNRLPAASVRVTR